jgi:DNA mismatch repair ATPase MutL
MADVEIVSRSRVSFAGFCKTFKDGKESVSLGPREIGTTVVVSDLFKHVRFSFCDAFEVSNKEKFYQSY